MHVIAVELLLDLAQRLLVSISDPRILMHHAGATLHLGQAVLREHCTSSLGKSRQMVAELAHCVYATGSYGRWCGGGGGTIGGK